MKNRSFKAFTLAEVLIALTIIGVIAALTVPALVQRTNKQEYVSALQKAYSTLSQAANMIITENGSPAGEDGWAYSAENTYKLFKKHLNIIKDCGSGAGCFEQLKGGYDDLHGKHNTTAAWNTAGSGKYKVILSDGIQIIFWGVDMAVDINGQKKPNRLARDVFYFRLTDKGLIPKADACGIPNSYSCEPSSTHSENHKGCACKVLSEGAMNY